MKETTTGSIRCSVENCVYHDCCHHCTAQAVQIGPRAAHTQSETVCMSFQAR